MIVVVPVHNQAQNLVFVLRGYLQQSLLPKAVVVVLDRCTDSSKMVADKLAPEFEAAGSRLDVRDTADFGAIAGFGAGRTRDVGLAIAQQIDPTSAVLFTDGDCLPAQTLVAHHESVLASAPGPRLTCGRRYDTLGPGETASFTMVLPDAQDDTRNGADYMEHLVCSPSVDRVVFNPQVFEQSWICWSCNLGMNAAAIAICRAVNAVVVGDGRRVFSPVFDGRWGGEDGFVGLSVWRCGGDVVMLSERSWVKHVWHKRGHTNIDHLRLVQLQDYELQKALFERRIPSAAVTTVNIDFGVDRTNMNPWVASQVRGFAPSPVVDRIQKHLPDDPLTQVVTALFCSGYIATKPGPGAFMVPQPVTQLGFSDLKRDVEALLGKLRRVPFQAVGSEITPAIPFDFSHAPVTFQEDAA